MSTFQSKRCGHCGTPYAYQTSGYGGIQDHNSSSYCQTCAEIVEKAIRAALEPVPERFEHDWRPTQDITIAELDRLDDERVARIKAKGGIPCWRVMAPLFDLERPGNVQHTKIVGNDGRTYRYEWWTDDGIEHGVVYLECSVEIATGEVVGPWDLKDYWKTPPTFYTPGPRPPRKPPTHEFVPKPFDLGSLRLPMFDLIERSQSLADAKIDSDSFLAFLAAEDAKPRCSCARCGKYDGCPNPAQNADGFCRDCASGGPHRGFDYSPPMTRGAYVPIEMILRIIDEPNRAGCVALLRDNRELFDRVPGSVHNHQAWEGGYLDHVREVMNIALALYEMLASKRPLPFSLSSALLVLYLHDIEKPWKYQPRPEGGIEEIPKMRGDKAAQHAFREAKLGKYGLVLSGEEAEAFKYVEGERDADYSNRRRVMNELAGFCHACDVLSARLWHDYPREGDDPWTGASR